MTDELEMSIGEALGMEGVEGTEGGEEQIPSGEEAGEEAGVEGEGAEVPEDVEEEDPIVGLRAQVVELQSQLASLKGASSSEGKEKEQALTLDPIDFLGDTPVDEFLGSKEGLNKLLNAVMLKGVTTGRAQVLRDLPMLVQKQVGEQTSIQAAAKDFYATNPDLKKYPGVVKAIGLQVSTEFPNKSVADVLVETAKRSRAALGLKAGATPGKKPGFVIPKGGRKPTPGKPSALEQDIAKTLNLG